METVYQIKIQGQLDTATSTAFEGFTLKHTPDGSTLLTGTARDQAALYGLLLRCRDLGLTLLAVYRVSEMGMQEKTMSKIQVQASRVINAPAQTLYNIMADYRVGHAAVLPKPSFKEMIVEKGGVGAGTTFRLRTEFMGQSFHYHMIVTEPQPGRLLVETDLDTGLSSRFTFEPLNGGSQTRMTIASEFVPGPGLKGVLERLLTPMMMRRVFTQELHNVAAYVRQQPAAQQA
jgi:uncharacterized protein YndB with AHSA1/START domain